MPLFMSECKIEQFELQIATFTSVNAPFYEWVQNKTIWATNCYILPCEMWMPLFMRECKIEQFELQIATFYHVNAPFLWVNAK